MKKIVRFSTLQTVGWVMSLHIHAETPETELLSVFCQSKDEAAFAELVRRHYPMVLHVALRRLRDRMTAEEVAQNVFVKFAKKARSLSAETVPGAWLHHVAVREAIDFQRKEYRHRRAMKNYRDEQQPHSGQATNADSLTTDLLESLDGALGRLSSSEQSAIMLRFQSGLALKGC